MPPVTSKLSAKDKSQNVEVESSTCETLSHMHEPNTEIATAHQYNSNLEVDVCSDNHRCNYSANKMYSAGSDDMVCYSRLSYLEKNCTMAMLILEDREREIQDLRRSLFDSNMPWNRACDNVMGIAEIAESQTIEGDVKPQNCPCLSNDSKEICCYRKALVALTKRDKQIEILLRCQQCGDGCNEIDDNLKERNRELANAERLHKEAKAELGEARLEKVELLAQLNSCYHIIDQKNEELDLIIKDYKTVAAENQEFRKGQVKYESTLKLTGRALDNNEVATVDKSQLSETFLQQTKTMEVGENETVTSDTEVSPNSVDVPIHTENEPQKGGPFSSKSNKRKKEIVYEKPDAINRNQSNREESEGSTADNDEPQQCSCAGNKCSNVVAMNELKVMCLNQSSSLALLQIELNEKEKELQYSEDYNQELRSRLVALQVNLQCLSASKTLEGDDNPSCSKVASHAAEEHYSRTVALLNGQLKDANGERENMEGLVEFLKSRLSQTQTELLTANKRKLELEKQLFANDPEAFDVVLKLHQEIHTLRKEKAEDVSDLQNQLQANQIAIGNVTAQNKEIRTQLGESQREVFRLTKEMADKNLHQRSSKDSRKKSFFNNSKKRKDSIPSKEKENCALIEKLKTQIDDLEQTVKKQEMENRELRWVLEHREENRLETEHEIHIMQRNTTNEENILLPDDETHVNQTTGKDTTGMVREDRQRKTSQLTKTNVERFYSATVNEGTNAKTTLRRQNIQTWQARRKSTPCEKEKVIEGLYLEIKREHVESLQLSEQCQQLRQKVLDKQKELDEQKEIWAEEVKRVSDEREHLCEWKNGIIAVKQREIEKRDKTIESLMSQVYVLQQKLHMRVSQSSQSSFEGPADVTDGIVSPEELRSEIEVTLQSRTELKDDRIRSLQRQLTSMRFEKNAFMGLMRQTVREKERELEIVAKQNSQLRQELGQTQRSLMKIHCHDIDGEGSVKHYSHDHAQPIQPDQRDSVTNFSATTSSDAQQIREADDSLGRKLSEQQPHNRNVNNLSEYPDNTINFEAVHSSLEMDIKRKDQQINELQERLVAKEVNLREMTLGKEAFEELRESATALLKQFSAIEELRSLYWEKQKSYEEERSTYLRQIHDLQHAKSSEEKGNSESTEGKLRTDISLKNDAIGLFKEKINALEDQVENNNLCDVKQDISRLSGHVSEIEINSQTLLHTLTNYLKFGETNARKRLSIVSDLRAKADLLESQLKLISQRESRELVLHQQLKMKDEDLQETRTKLGELDKELVILKKLYTTFRTQRSNLDERVKHLECKEFDDIKVALSEKEKLNEVLNRTVDSLQSQLAEARSHETVIRTQLQSSETKVSRLQCTIDTMSADNEVLKTFIQKRNKKVHELENELKAAENRHVVESLDMRQTLADRSSNLERELQSQTQSLENANEKVVELSERIEALQLENERLENQCQSLSETTLLQQNATRTLEKHSKDECYLHSSNSQLTTQLLQQRNHTIMELQEKLSKAEIKLSFTEKKIAKIIANAQLSCKTTEQQRNNTASYYLYNTCIQDAKDSEEMLVYGGNKETLPGQQACNYPDSNKTTGEQQTTVNAASNDPVCHIDDLVDYLHQSLTLTQEQSDCITARSGLVKKEFQNLYQVAHKMNKDVQLAQRQIQEVTATAGDRHEHLDCADDITSRSEHELTVCENS